MMESNWRDRSNQGKPNNWQKQNYQNQKKRKHPYHLEPGIAGFLCMCCDKLREKEGVRDAYNILNEYADQLLGPEQLPTDADNHDDESPSTSDDVDASLEDELATLKEKRDVPLIARRFQVVDTGVNSVIFIKTNLANPTKLAHYIVSRISDTKTQKSKALLRILPIEVTCKAYLDEICKAADSLLERYFSSGDKTFSIVFNHRNNDSVKRQEVIDAIAGRIVEKNSTNKVDLKNPQLAVLIEIVRRNCCLSVIPEYYKLKKYNILELSGAADAARKEKELSDENNAEKTEISKTEEQGISQVEELATAN